MMSRVLTRQPAGYRRRPASAAGNGLSTSKNSNCLTCKTPEPVAVSARKYILNVGLIGPGASFSRLMGENYRGAMPQRQGFSRDGHSRPGKIGVIV